MKEKRKRHTVRWNDEVERRAQFLIDAYAVDSIQELVVDLIREEWERRDLSSEATGEALKLAEMIGEGLPDHPAAKPKSSKPSKRRGV